MKIVDVMTGKPRYVPHTTMVSEAARIMRDDDIGFVPVEKDDRMVGMLTDRDITVRCCAADQNPGETAVEDVMTKDVQWLFDDQDVGEAERLMQRQQIRRLPVVNRAKRLVGVVSLGDLATEAGDEQETLRAVSNG